MDEENINETFQELKKKFNIIKNEGFIKGIKQKSFGNSGLTFENLIGKDNDELQFADYKGVEIKVKSKNRSNYGYIALFSLVPSNCFGIELKKLRENYGYYDKDFPSVKVLTSSIFANICLKQKSNYFFKLYVKYCEKRLYLYIYDDKNNLVNKDIYWDFKDIIKTLKNKMFYLALVKYDTKIVNKIKYFNYTSINFYKFKGIDDFFNLLENGLIRVYICLGVYKSGNKIGLEHDHGICFEIKEYNLLKLYEKYEK